MKFSSLLIQLFCLGFFPSIKGNPLHASNDVENGIPEEVARKYSIEFAGLPDNFDESLKDNSVFDKLLAINEKSEKSGNEEKLFEGDIVVTQSLKEIIENRKRGAASISKRHLWPVNNGKHEIPYVISKDVSRSYKILDAMKEWMEKVPCLRFVQRSNQKGYLYFYRGSGCSSYVGYQRRNQSISLAEGCMYHGIILHEIGHALGFWHEQSRSDRDQYITIHWENIKPGKEFNFRKVIGRTDDKSHGYDYGSIMHYGPKAFSKNKNDTITAKNGHSIGQRRRLSAIDIQQAKTMYTECKNESIGEGGTANCTFDDGTICNYQLGFGQFDWTVHKGSTPSVETGATSDVSGRGYYLYIETSSPRVTGDKATILTPYLNGAQCMKFSYHMYGRDIGSLNIFANNQKIFSKSGNQGNQWVSVHTPILQSGRYKVKFEGSRGRDFKGDIAIDEISFTPGSCPFQAVRCNFDQGNLCSFTNGHNDDFDWTIRRGCTPSRGTGPSRDVSRTGNYVYIETSSPRKQGEKAYLVSPQVSGAQCVRFSYHMNGGGIGSLKVYQDTGVLQELFTKSGNQGNQWKKAEIQVKGSSFSVVFTGVRGNDFRGDIALDEISITSGQC